MEEVYVSPYLTVWNYSSTPRTVTLNRSVGKDVSTMPPTWMQVPKLSRSPFAGQKDSGNRAASQCSTPRGRDAVTMERPCM
jgi:hypothetical protein